MGIAYPFREQKLNLSSVSQSLEFLFTPLNLGEQGLGWFLGLLYVSSVL